MAETIAENAELAKALQEGAARLRLKREDIARELGASVRSVSRWNTGQHPPHPDHHQRLVALLAPAGADVASRLRAALGLPEPAPPSAVVRDEAALKRDIDHALYAAAEAIDRSPRAVRAAFADLLGRLGAMNVSMEDARRLMAIVPAPIAESRKRSRAEGSG